MSSSPNRKRSRTETDKISPPPLRRKRIVEDAPKTSAEAIHRGLNTTSFHAPGDQFQIFSWNVNGICHLLPKTQKSIKAFFAPPSPQGERDEEEKPGNLRDFLKRHKWPQYLGLQERIATTGPEYKAYFSLPRDKYNVTGWGGKVYGVCTLIRSDVANLPGQRTKEVDWDLEGRVLVTELPSLRIAIVNGYWVNGTMNPYRDSETGHVAGIRHHRKRRFHSLMLDEVEGYQGKSWEVVLVGDVNIARTPLDGYPGIRVGSEHVKNRADFNAKFFEDEDGMKAIDTWRCRHGNKRGYSYHGEAPEDWGSSCDRVDLGMVTRGLVDAGALVGAEIYESVLERGGSDHCPISVVLSEKIIMQRANEEVPSSHRKRKEPSGKNTSSAATV